jgi:hypothetical protein
MESWALEREGSMCITFPLAPCLCCYSLAVVDHPTTETFAWAGSGALPRHVSATCQKVTSPAIIGCWRHPCARAYTRLQEHVIRVVKILDSRTLCALWSIKILNKNNLWCIVLASSTNLTKYMKIRWVGFNTDQSHSWLLLQLIQIDRVHFMGNRFTHSSILYSVRWDEMCHIGISYECNIRVKRMWQESWTQEVNREKELLTRLRLECLV